MMKNIIFKNFLLDLSLIPWYGVYYSMLSINKYTKIMKFDFDIGLHLLVTDINKFNITGFLKLREYKNYILIGSSNYIFLDNFIMFFF